MLTKEILVLIHTAFKSLSPIRTRRRPARRCAPASRTCLESLEDRCLLSFSPGVNYTVGDHPQAVVKGDFNGDGRLDLAVANINFSNVSVLLGNANGTFQTAQNFATGLYPSSVAVGDFNKDGKLDLATGNQSSVSVLLGNGNGTFGTPGNTMLDMQGDLVAVGDFNADGKLDLGVAGSFFQAGSSGDYYSAGYPNAYLNYATVLLGNGTGALGSAGLIGVGNGDRPVRSVAAGDFNADGRDDFVTINSIDPYGFSGDYARVLLANPDGSLGGGAFYAIGHGPTWGTDSAHSVAAGDVNGDGKVDLAIANLIGDDVSVLLGTGTGTFGAVRDYAVGSQPLSVGMGDFNGDGKIDLVTANAGSLTVLLGTGTGSFRGPVNVDVGTSPVAIAVGDFNGDRRLDVVSANSSTSNVSVLLNDGTWPATDTPSISVNDVTVIEGNSGTTAATFTVSLSATYSQTVSVHYSTADQDAVAGSDYEAASGTLTFAPGVTSRSVTVLVNGDRVAEQTESFSLVLSSPTNGFVDDASGTGTIVDDEPYVSIAVYTGMEGNSGTTPFTFLVTLSVAYDSPVSVDFATADLTPDEEYWYELRTATAGVDYTAKSGTVTFAAGQTTQTITVLVNGDRVGEPDESFSVNLTGTNAGRISTAQGLGYIVNDEPTVVMGGGASVQEGNSGTKSLTFTFALTAASDAPVTITYATADGTATLAGGDYRAATGTVTFAAGQTVKSVTVLVNGDRIAEDDEFFYLNLTGSTGAFLNNARGYGYIQDDEPRISINSVSVTEGNSGTKLMTFTVKLSAAYDQAVNVNFATHDDSATVGGGDYVAKSGTLKFAPGQTMKTFTVTIKGDTKREADESFYVLLSGASSNAIIPDAYGWGSILNDDTPPRKKR